MTRRIKRQRIREIMTSSPVMVSPETDIRKLKRLFDKHDVNAFPVVDDAGTVVGLVSRLDLFRLYLLPYQAFIPALEATWVSSVGAIMSRAVVTVPPHASALEAMAVMVEHGIRTIPVVEQTPAGPMLAGVITRRDLTPALVD